MQCIKVLIRLESMVIGVKGITQFNLSNLHISGVLCFTSRIVPLQTFRQKVAKSISFQEELNIIAII